VIGSKDKYVFGTRNLFLKGKFRKKNAKLEKNKYLNEEEIKIIMQYSRIKR